MKTDPLALQAEVTEEEQDDLKCQIGTSSWGGSRVPPDAFTEQGIVFPVHCCYHAHYEPGTKA